MSISAIITPSETAALHLAGQRVVLAISELRKSFGGQVVLDGVNAELREGPR